MKSFSYTFPPGSYRTDDGSSKVAKAWPAAPGLIVTNTYGYTVTHQTSGYAASTHYDLLKDAIKVAGRLAAEMDWTVDHATLTATMQERGENFRRKLRSIANGAEYVPVPTVEETLEFIRQCVSGKCSHLDLIAIKGAIIRAGY